MVLETKEAPFNWHEDYPAAVTVCDRDGIIIAMNKKSLELFEKRGGAKLIGASLFDCHPESSNKIIRRQLKKHEANFYITERKSGRRLIQQVPWYRDGVFAGIIETVSPLSGEIVIKKRE